ncbi:MAG TPA: adenylate/guanylate cyclase domain-containing protein, partial [Rectinemataceae bacterium]|nr:adenylate/guanylate cyclase domain-containing protein [Rectinemataceae bacterium]
MTDRDELKAGERRVATILFSDMKGFTSLSEHADPEEMDGLMNRVFGLFEEIIRGYGGQVEKYIGDALVAVFGVPDLHEDDPSRAVHSALDFQTRLKTESARVQGRFAGRSGAAPNLSFRTGIHTGLVTTGRRGEFDVVTGHAMSVAQRIEAAAAPGTVFVSEAVREKCEGEFEFDLPRRLEAKGKTEPVTIYQVKGEVSGAVRDSGPLVGRRELLDEMLKAYIRNRYDEVSGFYLTGEAGSGKTRLIAAFLEKLRQFPDFATPILSARAQKFRPGGFSVILDILLGYLGLEASVDRERAAKAAATLPGLSEAVVGRFTEIVCCADPGSPDSSSIATLYDVFESILERHAGDLYPIVVCIDNAASMDRLSREFFQYFFKHGRIKPFFLLAGREQPGELRKAFLGLKAMRIGPLAAEDSEALVRYHWPEAEGEGLERILSLSGGNPLFLREYAAYARKHRDLSSLPATVQNIFLAGLERYPPDWRDLAKRLSSFLHSFTAADARYVQGADEAAAPWVEEALAQFEADGLLVREGDSYSFRLDVFKKALYSSLLNHNKRVLHGLIADILLKRERPHRIRLIHHLVRAERYAEAAKVLLDDPDRTYNYEALPYIDVLIRRLKDDGKAIIRLLITKAAQLFNGGKIEESEAVLKRIMRTAIIRRDATLMGYAYHQICAYNHMTYSFQKAIFAGSKA